MINLLEESVRAAVKDTIAEQNRMDWSDSVFREHPKYFGDVEFKNESIIGDNGIVSSKKYLAFRNSNNKIGILSTDFSTNITEKLAQGRKAEYGSKTYTTKTINTIDITENANINVLQFDPFNDNNLFCGDNNGTLSIFNGKDKSCITSINKLSTAVNSIASHPCTADILAVGGKGNISIIDLNKNGQILTNTKIMDGENNIINMAYSSNGNYLQCITDDKYLFIYDPRTDSEINNTIQLLYTPNNIVNLYKQSEIAVCGMTSFLEPILYAYDVRNQLSQEIINENYVYKQNYKHKQCKPMMKYDVVTGLLYVAFQSCADVLALNIHNNFSKEALYHSVTDTFMSFDVLPKQAVKKREINKIVKFSKNRIQQLVHTRGGKLIYDFISNKAKQSLISSDEYFTDQKDIEYDFAQTMGRCVAMDFEEQKKRSVSLYIHVTGREPLSNYEKYFDLKVLQTINCNLGLNIKVNDKYALFPEPTYGGGALGVIKLNKAGRKKQVKLSAHSEKITTFDIGTNEYNNNLVITGSPDCKAIISKINEKESTDQITNCEQLFTLKCAGRVTFVSFHKRIRNLCVIASNKEHSNESNIYLYNYNTGKTINNIKLENTNNICDVQFESNIGLIAAISSSNGNIKIMNILNGEILFQFKSNTFARDTKLFWATYDGKNQTKYCNKLICLGFGKSSVRKFSLYNLEHIVNTFYENTCNIMVDNENESKEESKQEIKEEKKEEKTMEDDSKEFEAMCSHSFGVSNAIPVGFYDSNDNLFYITSIGDRKIKTYEFTKKGIAEMNASYQSNADIQGMDFGVKRFVDITKVELAKCFKLTKDGVISQISFYIPRKRLKYFQDDLYSSVLSTYNNDSLLDIIEYVNSENENANERIEIKLNYVSLKPDDMELLSEAPTEQLTEHQKRRNSQIKLMEASKLKEQPQSTEQAFDQFSRMVADAPTQNRWDAQNIGTEVADDEWSD